MSQKPLEQYAKRTLRHYNGWRRYGYAFGRFLCWLGVTLFLKATIKGRENIPKTTRFIVASNHDSNWDPPLVGAAINTHPIAFMAKKELFQVPLLNWWLDSVGAFLVDREKVSINSIRTSQAVIDSDHFVLGIFPEGTRHKTEDSNRTAKKGVAFIAKATKADVLPIAIVTKPQNPREKTVVIGQVIPFQGQDVEAFTTEIMDHIQALIDAERASML
jgi:1-acyl-sn-glycerol-3-phosphate acyltransferase